MSGPKFHVGQRVAVCTRNLLVVIPSTVVIKVRWTDATDSVLSHLTGKTHRQIAEFGYLVKDSPIGLFGQPIWFSESSLRPLNDDDYKDDETQEINKPLRMEP